jgi:hypothetical protein
MSRLFFLIAVLTALLTRLNSLRKKCFAAAILVLWERRTLRLPLRAGF